MASAEIVAGPAVGSATPRGRWLPALAFVVSLSALVGGEAALSAAQPGVCSYKQATGRPCLGCGGTHAFGAAARGHLPAAVAANPLGAWLGLANWLLVLASVAATLAGRPRWLGLALGAVALSAPVAFVWNAVAWWASSP